MGCAKKILTLLTILILIIGLGLLGIAIWHIAETRSIYLTGNQVLDIGFLAFSCFLSVTGLCGGYGLLADRKCLLKLYFALIAVFLLAGIGLVILAFAFEKKLEELVVSNWNKLDDSKRIQVQERLICCGMANLKLYHNSSSHPSCFKEKKLGNPRNENCYEVMKEWLEKNKYAVIGGAAALFLVQLVILISTMIVILQMGYKSSKVAPSNNHARPRMPRQSHANGRHTFRPAGFEMNDQYGLPAVDESPTHDYYNAYLQRKDSQKWAKTRHR